MVVEITTFRLREDAEESEFVAADARVQTEFYYRQPGLVRRTVARGADGAWLVLTFWSKDAGAKIADDLVRFIERSTIATTLYTTLD